MTSEQLRMARAALKIGVRELSSLASVDKMSIVGIENGRIRGHASTHEKLRQALENAGIVFLDERPDELQPTVALRIGVQPIGDDTEGADTTTGAKPGEGLDTAPWDDFGESDQPERPLPEDTARLAAEMTDEDRAELREFIAEVPISAESRKAIERAMRG